MYDTAMFLYGLDLVIQHRYFGTYLFGRNAIVAHFCVPPLMALLAIGSTLAMLGSLFGSSSSMGYVRLVGFLMMAIAYIVLAISILFSKVRNSSVFLPIFLPIVVVGFIIYGAGIASNVEVCHPQQINMSRNLERSTSSSQ